MTLKLKYTLFWITFFSIAMGLLESAVVVYLRELYYPHGFSFPLQTMSTTTALTELLRELATLIMLLSIAVLTGKNKNTRFAWFIYSFAIWDIFYYVFLKLLLNWPESFLTWDILFLLPTTWVGPVICPVLLSIAMIALALLIVFKTENGQPANLKPWHWISLIAGSVIVIVSFTLEYSQYILQQFSFTQLFSFTPKLMNYAIQFIPQQFPWLIFGLGFAVILAPIVDYGRK